MLDFARVFPPTAEADVRKTFLYKVFRPELVKRFHKPLCSDAFSPFARSDPKRKEHEEEVMEATDYLFQKVCSACYHIHLNFVIFW